MSAPSLTPSKAARARHAQPPVDGPPQHGGAFGRSLKRNLTAHGFLIGAVLCFAFFSWYPMVREFFLAFQKTDQGEVSWVGLENLETVFNDPAFWQAWRNTALFTVLAWCSASRCRSSSRSSSTNCGTARGTSGCSSTCR